MGGFRDLDDLSVGGGGDERVPYMLKIAAGAFELPAKVNAFLGTVFDSSGIAGWNKCKRHMRRKELHPTEALLLCRFGICLAGPGLDAGAASLQLGQTGA